MDKDIDKDILQLLEWDINKHSNCITGDEQNYFKNISSTNSNFDSLSKIHKSFQLKEAIEKQNTDIIIITEPSDLKLRPIVRGPNCPTRKFSNLIDILLKPFIKEVKSYLRNSTDFLNKCQWDKSSNTITATFDVVSFYANIWHNLGLEAINYFITTYCENLLPRFKKEFVIE